jgi:FXSXX-COOH protein
MTSEGAIIESLTATRDVKLKEIPPAHAARIVRRVVDGEHSERLEVAAFNSAP